LVTLWPKAGGETTKSIRDMWWHWHQKPHFKDMMFTLKVTKIHQTGPKFISKHKQDRDDYGGTLRGNECAENIIMTSFLACSGNSLSSVLILSATVFASRGCVAHRSIMLHLTPAGNFLKEENYGCTIAIPTL
jgi:hypothetical protein